MINNKPILVAIVILFMGCSKDEKSSAEDSTEIITNSFFPLEVGNYWIYEFGVLETDGRFNDNKQLDTMKVSHDTLIEGETYFVITSKKPYRNMTWVLRDNNGNIEGPEGKTFLPQWPNNKRNNEYFATTSSGDTIYESWEENNALILRNSNLGKQRCLLNVTVHKSWPQYGGQKIADSNYYAPIGPVRRSYSYLSGTKMIGELIETNVE